MMLSPEEDFLAAIVDGLEGIGPRPLPPGWVKPDEDRWIFRNERGRGEIFVEYIAGQPSCWHWAHVWVGKTERRPVLGLAGGAFAGIASAMTAVEEALQ